MFAEQGTPNADIKRVDSLSIMFASVTDEIAIRKTLRRGVFGKLASPYINSRKPSATRGLFIMATSAADVRLGLLITRIGIALIPTSPSVFGGLGSAALITTGVSFAGYSAAEVALGFAEFSQYGGFKGMINELFR